MSELAGSASSGRTAEHPASIGKRVNPHGVVNLPSLCLMEVPSLEESDGSPKAIEVPKKRYWSVLDDKSKSYDALQAQRKLREEARSFAQLPNWENPDINSSKLLPLRFAQLYPQAGRHPGYSSPTFSQQAVLREDIDVRTASRAQPYFAGRFAATGHIFEEDSEDEEVREHVTSIYSPQGTHDNAFLLHKLLTVEECNYIVAKATPHVAPVDKYFEHRYRKSDRALIRCPKLTAELYRRILPMLRGDDYKGRIPLCFGQKGVWVPFGLNDVVKINHYGVGGMFAQHRDGPWIPREDQASIYTVIIYLTEEFSGGLTCLFQSHGSPQELEKCSQAARRQGDGSKVQAVERVGQLTLSSTQSSAVIPAIGTALLFNHDMWHAASPVMNAGPRGKYILRTELIFQKVHSLYVDRFAFAREEDFRDLVQLYKKSQDALAAGNRREFVDLYQEVVDRQRTVMLDSWGQAPPLTRAFLSGCLNFDTQSHILGFLSVGEVTKLILLCRAAYYQIVQSDYWEERCFAEYGPSVAGDQAVLKHSSVTGSFKSQLPLDWYTIYGQRQLMKKHEFQPVALMVTPQGAEVVANRNQLIFFGPLSNLPYRFRVEVAFHTRWLSEKSCAAREFSSPFASKRLHETFAAGVVAGGATGTGELHPRWQKVDPITSNLCIVDSRFPYSPEQWQNEHRENWIPPPGYYILSCPNVAETEDDPYHMNLPPEERFAYRFGNPRATAAQSRLSSRQGQVQLDTTPICHPTSGRVRWSPLASIVEFMITPIWNPLLLVGHPAWFLTQEPLSTEVGRSATEAGNPSSEGEDDPTDPRYRACLDLFELTRTPAVHLVHPASVSLMVLGSLTGNRADATPKLHSVFPRRPNTLLAGGPKRAQGEIPAEPTLVTGKGNPTPKEVVGIIIPAEDYDAPTLQAHSSGLRASRVEELADVALDSAVDFFLTVVDRSTSQALETVRLSCCRGEAALQKRHEGVPDDAHSTLVLEALFHRYSGAIPLYLQVLTRPANSEGDWRAETDQSSGRVGPCIHERDSEGAMRLRLMSLLHWTSLKKGGTPFSLGTR